MSGCRIKSGMTKKGVYEQTLIRIYQKPLKDNSIKHVFSMKNDGIYTFTPYFSIGKLLKRSIIYIYDLRVIEWVISPHPSLAKRGEGRFY